MDNLLKLRWVYFLSVCVISCVMSLDANALVLNYQQLGNQIIDRQHGILRIHGALTDSPCRLSMHTTDQTIDLGTIPISNLPNVGIEGEGVFFQVELTDCLAVKNHRTDRQAGRVLFSRDEPGVAIRFTSIDVDGTGQYALLNGVSGVGIMIKDMKGRSIPLNERSYRQLLPSGQSTLTYQIIPIRLRDIVSPGIFHAVMGFQMSYD